MSADAADEPHRFCPSCPFAGRTVSRTCPECGADFFGGDFQ